MTRVRDGDIQR